MHIFSIKLNQIKDDADLAELFRHIPPRSTVIIEDVDAMSDVVLKRAEDRSATAASNKKGKQQKQAEKQDETDEKTGKDDKWPWIPKITLSGLLNVIDGVSGRACNKMKCKNKCTFTLGRHAGAHGMVFVMTTNHKDKLDPALLRAGK